MIYILSTVVVLGILVFIHELGHFLAAKAVGIRVEAFSVGFPPNIFSKQIGETKYSIGAIPFGGYTKMSGMIDESFDKSFEGLPPQDYEYRAKKTWQKIFVTIAGIVMNLLLAIIIFSVLTGIRGVAVPSNEPILETIYENTPAMTAGLESGDRVLAVDGRSVDTWRGMAVGIQAAGANELELTIYRDGSEKIILVTPVLQKSIEDGNVVEKPVIGISGHVDMQKAGFFGSIDEGFKSTGYWLNMTFVSLKLLVTGQESIKNVGGVVFIGKLAGESAKSGASAFFGLIAILSVNLALLNILPIPGLDGGHIIFAIIEGIMGREIRIKTKMAIQQAGMFLLFGFIIFALVNDVVRLFAA